MSIRRPIPVSNEVSSTKTRFNIQAAKEVPYRLKMNEPDAKSTVSRTISKPQAFSISTNDSPLGKTFVGRKGLQPEPNINDRLNLTKTQSLWGSNIPKFGGKSTSENSAIPT